MSVRPKPSIRWLKSQGTSHHSGSGFLDGQGLNSQEELLPGNFQRVS